MKPKIALLRDLKILSLIYLLLIFIVLTVVILTQAQHQNIGFFIRDMATVANINPFYGILSIIGIIFWFATTTLCWFGFYLLPAITEYRPIRHLLMSIGILSLVLGADDLFLFHEVVFPDYLNLFGEKVILLGYLLALGIILYRFRAIIQASKYGILLMSGFLLGLSIAIDRLPEGWLGDWSYFVEDLPKLFGIVAWCVFWGSIVYDVVKTLIRARSLPPEVKN